jgi:hypothetical protein
MNREPQPIGAADLFVVLDKEYRRRHRRCSKCGFSIPYGVFRGEGGYGGAWAVDPSEECAPECRHALEELVSTYQKKFRLERSARPGLA